MDHLEQAKTLYRKRHDHASVISPEDHASLSMSITKMIRTCLMQQGGVASFKYLPFIQVIKRTVTSNRFQGDRAAMAFTVLEKYLLLLVAQPWKREFWLLKTYGGYFCTKVKAHLDRPEEILELVGYARVEGSSDENQLVLDHPPDTEVALNVAFDCQVASVECQFIGEYYEKMKCVGLDLSDAMNVLLSGAPNDPLVGSPVVTLQGKNLQVGGTNNHFMNTKTDSVKRNGGRAMPPPPQRILASGGMGMGVVSSASMHQVTGVPPRPMVSHHDLPPPAPPQSQAPPGLRSYSDAAGPSPVGLKVDLPEMRHPPGLMDTGSRTQYIASQPAGSRASYGSSVCAPSSGYGSASGGVSVYSPLSSAHTASSGYSSGAPSQQSTHGNYVYPPNTHVGDHVDSPQMTVLPSSRFQPHRPHRIPLPQQPPPNFPYIDEDESTNAPFPEATHEEHLRESLRNLQGVGPDKNCSKTVPVMMSSSEVIRRPPHDGMQAPYDDWRWFPKNQHCDAPPSYEAVITAGHHSSTMIQRPAHLSADNMRSANIQPATAVTAMLNQGPMASNMDMKRHVSPMDARQQREHAGDYPPLTVVGGSAVGTGPLPGSSHHRRVVSSADSLLQDGAGRGMGMPQSQTVYYPPTSEDVPFQRYTNTVSGQSLPQRQAPTFAQATASRRPVENPALLPRQAQNVALNNLDKVSHPKPLNVARDGSGSSSEVIMRSKVRENFSHGGRANSLVSPHSAGQPPELSRQSSRSMDMGLMRWKCRTCTMENSAVEVICAACSKSRDAPDMQFPAAGVSKVVCPSCTFENQPGCKMCEMCSGPLSQDVHTYV